MANQITQAMVDEALENAMVNEYDVRIYTGEDVMVLVQDLAMYSHQFEDADLDELRVLVEDWQKRHPWSQDNPWKKPVTS